MFFHQSRLLLLPVVFVAEIPLMRQRRVQHQHIVHLFQMPGLLQPLVRLGQRLRVVARLLLALVRLLVSVLLELLVQVVGQKPRRPVEEPLDRLRRV